jgi:O-acetyl-ADP-ribose deacetylase (regulator of RNase III)
MIGNIMISEATGDLFRINAQVRVNTVNCVGVMGAGIALAFRHKYPAMFEDYKAKCRRGDIRPGRIDVWSASDGTYVVNFPTKVHWREPSRYEYIDEGLTSLREFLVQLKDVTVALPALGCGHGGLDWSRVRPMIESKLGNLRANIVVFAPEYSRQVGHSAVIGRLSEEGFREYNLATSSSTASVRRNANRDRPTRRVVFVSGDEELLSSEWVGLVPSKEPGERELRAIGAIANELTKRDTPPTIALIEASHKSAEIVNLFLQCKLSVVVILPFGPLSNSMRPLDRASRYSSPGHVFVSIAKPEERCSSVTFSRALSFMEARSSRILLTDPKPQWIEGDIARVLSRREIFYIDYDSLSPELAANRKVSAHPVRRRAQTGQPNLEPIFKGWPNA